MMPLPGPPNAVDPKSLSERELLEAVYRAIYGEHPIQPGLARRVSRLELLFLLMVLIVAGFEGVQYLI